MKKDYGNINGRKDRIRNRIGQTRTIRLYSGKTDKFHWSLRQEIRRNGNVRCSNFHFSEYSAMRKYYQKNRHHDAFKRRIKTAGICLFCGDINWKHLEEHHPDKQKLPNFKITLCANCHRDLHFDMGDWGKEIKQND